MEIDESYPIKIYSEMKDFIGNIKRTENETSDIYKECFLRNKDLEQFNKKVANENYWGIDKYNIVIRFKDFNKPKSIYGWTLDKNNDIVSIHVDQDLANYDTVDIHGIAMTKIIKLNPKALNPKSTIYKIYTKLGIKI